MQLGAVCGGTLLCIGILNDGLMPEILSDRDQINVCSCYRFEKSPGRIDWLKESNLTFERATKLRNAA